MDWQALRKYLSAVADKARSNPSEAVRDLNKFIRKDNTRSNIEDKDVVLDHFLFAYRGTWQDKYYRRKDRSLTDADNEFVEQLIKRAQRVGNTFTIYKMWTFLIELPSPVLSIFLHAASNLISNLDLSRMLVEISIDKHHAQIAKELVYMGADVMKPYRLSEFDEPIGALYAACAIANEPMIKVLVDAMDPSMPTFQYIMDTCLCHVCKASYLYDFDDEPEYVYMNICKFLVSKGARPYVYIAEFDANAITLAEEKVKVSNSQDNFNASIVKYLKSIQPPNDGNITKIHNLPIRNIMSSYLNTKSTRALLASSKAVAQVADGVRNEKEFAMLTFDTATPTLINGKSSFHFPYDKGYSVVFQIQNKACAKRLGFSGIQYNFAKLFTYKPGLYNHNTLRLIDLQVLSESLMQLHLRDKTQWYFNYILLHREVTTSKTYTDLLDYSNQATYDIGNGPAANIGLFIKYMPNHKEVGQRFRNNDSFYKQVFVLGYYKALKFLLDETGLKLDDANDRTMDGDAIGDVMDGFLKQTGNHKNQTSNSMDIPDMDYELQNIKRRARAQVLGDYNSKLRAPFGTSQAIARFTPAENRPRGQNLTQIINNRASNLEEEATQRVHKAVRKYAQKGGRKKASKPAK